MFNSNAAAAANPFEAASNLGQKRGMGEEEEEEQQQMQMQMQMQQQAQAQAHPEMPGFKRRMVSHDALAFPLLARRQSSPSSEQSNAGRLDGEARQRAEERNPC